MNTLKSFQKYLVTLPVILFILLPSAVLYAKSAEILAIDFKQNENEFDIIINGQGNLRYTASFQRNPLRIELLFVDTKFKMRQAIPEQENSFIHQVVATMLTSPESDKTARITIDLKSEFQYSVEGASDGIIIHLFGVDRSESTLSEVELSEADQAEEIDPPEDYKSEDIWAEIEKANIPGESEKTNVPGEPEKTNIPAEPEKTYVPAEPGKTNVPAEPEKTNVPAEPEKTYVPAEPEKTNVPAEPEKTNVPAEPEKTNVPAEPEKTNVPAEPEKTNVPAEPEKTNVPAEPEKTNVPAEPGTRNTFVENTKPEEGVPPDTAYDELVIGPEDLLDISVFQLPEFSLSARVLGDGTITMPLVGSIKLSGMTRKEAELEIARALTAKQVNRPSVSVTIKEYKSRQVSVLGSVRTAGIYYLTSKRTLLQLLSEAGGLTNDAGTTCYIFRGSTKVQVDLHDLMQNGNQELNINIHPGDVINVPSLTRTFVYVLGAVRSPGAVEFIPSVGLTLAAAIARAGGPSRLANLSNIQIKRKDQNGTERIIKANLKDIISNKVPDVPLMADDLINVPESFF